MLNFKQHFTKVQQASGKRWRESIWRERGNDCDRLASFEIMRGYEDTKMHITPVQIATIKQRGGGSVNNSQS